MATYSEDQQAILRVSGTSEAAGTPSGKPADRKRSVRDSEANPELVSDTLAEAEAKLVDSGTMGVGGRCHHAYRGLVRGTGIRTLFRVPTVASGQEVSRTDRLLFRPRRAVLRKDPRLLHVRYGGKAVTFEGPALSFGQRLVCQDEFVAEQARTWSDGEAHSWEEVRSLLELLLREAVLERVGVECPSGESPLRELAPDAPMPPLRWRTLEEGCQFVGEVHGIRLEAGQLETAVGASQMSNFARDESGRQIGENTVALRDPALAELVPTEWRRCPFPGSRFDDPRPMNVTALRQMASDLEKTLGAMEALRRRFLVRLGTQQPTLGQLFLLARVAAALPAWLLCRPGAPVVNGAIPAWVASLQKLVGGVNMPITCLLLDLGEPFGATTTPDQLWCVTEELGLFITEAGVCSGTPKMVERSLQAFVYGAEHAEDELLVEALGDVDAAIDYALHASLADLCRWACRVRMRTVTAKALATGAGAGREDVEQLRACCARASEECDPERELQFIEEQRQAIVKMGPGLSRPVDPGEPPGLWDGEEALSGALRQVLWLEEKGLWYLEGHQDDLNRMLGREPHRRLTRSQLALGERRQEVALWSVALAKIVGVAL